MASGKELSRKEALQTLGVFACGLCLPKSFRNLKEAVDSKDSHPYIAQKTWNSCGYAVMAMLIADRNDEDVECVYQKILDYYEMIGKLDAPLGAQGLSDYFEREKIGFVKGNVKGTWQAEDLKDQLFQNGSTILNVTSNYGEVVADKNNANHFIIIDNILNIDIKGYSTVRDPLRSSKQFDTLEEPKPFMIPNDNGSLNVPTEKLFPALGTSYIYLKEGCSNDINFLRRISH
jgi:hypothetical protein